MKSIRDLVRSSGKFFAAAACVGAAVLTVHRDAPAHNATGSCTVNFDNTFALSNILNNARAMIAVSTGFNSAGKLDSCSNSTGACWTYRHRCATNYVNVDDLSGYGHYHLSFTNPGFFLANGTPICPFGDPGDGYGSGFERKIGSSCVIPNWSAEPRGLDTHDAAQWIGIQMKAPGSSTNTTFDLQRMHVGGTTPIQFWFHSVIDGNWYVWSSLAANTNWTLAAAHDVDMVELRGANGQTNSYRIEDFDIQD